MQIYNYHTARFIISAPNVQQLPPDQGAEIAFVGRSNAGKSSAINILTHQKTLARTSKIPGCTQFINLFEIDRGIRLADLPGYGYAKMPKNFRQYWEKNFEVYFQKRRSLKGVVLFMDIRHPLKKSDWQMIHWIHFANLPLLLLLTKADKLAKREQKNQLILTRNAIVPIIQNIQLEVFSSLKKQGLDKLQDQLTQWFN